MYLSRQIDKNIKNKNGKVKKLLEYFNLFFHFYVFLFFYFYRVCTAPVNICAPDTSSTFSIALPHVTVRF